MDVLRIYDGPDGKSCLEELAFSDVQRADVFEAVNGLAFRTPQINRLLDYHPGPRRQFLIILSGIMELGKR